MGSVREVRKGIFELRSEHGYDAMGNRKRKFKTVEAKNKTEAKKLLAAFETELDSEGYVEANKDMTFKQFVEKWKSEFGQTDLDPNTYDNYCTQLNCSILPYFKKKKIKDIRTLHLVEYFNHEKREGTGQYALERRHRVIRSLFGKAAEWEIIAKDPSLAVKKPTVKRREKDIYDEREIDLLLNKLKTLPINHQLMIKLALFGGLRRGEVLGIDLDKDINFVKNKNEETGELEFESGTINIRHSLQRTKTAGLRLKGVKNDQERLVTFPSELMKELWGYRKERWQERNKEGKNWIGFKDEKEKNHFLLFGHTDGKPYSPDTVSQMWERVVDKLGVKKISFHDLRHSSATYLLSQGIDMKTIQKRLGHQNITTTLNLYSHVTETMSEKPVAVFEKIIEKQ
ncbi:MAG: tyrosine-type recombinase/integrase [Sporolactobacillus sp.]